MSWSLRRTVAVRFAATMAVALVGVAAVVFWGTSRVVRHQFDEAIAAAAFLVGEAFDPTVERLEADPMLFADPSGYRREVNRYIVLRDRRGVVLLAIPRWAGDLPLDTLALRGALERRRVWVSGDWHGDPVRSTYYPLERAGVVGDRVLQVAGSLNDVRAVERDLLLAFIAVVLLGTSATLIGAWYLAGSAVRPVGEITAQATRIEAGTLDQRIAAHADTEEYRGLVAVLNRMLDRLDRAFQAQQRFTADVGHEFRSPLTALRGEMEVALRAERSPREYQRVLHSALEEIERLTLVTEDLLWLARAESDLVAARRVPTDVNSLVDAALEVRRGAVEEKGLTVSRAFGYPDGGLAVDPALVSKLLSELLDNALKFAPFGGDVVVGTEPLAHGVRLFVEDSGPGIALDVFPHLFEPFYRADEARTRGTGTGLGLTIAQTITRLHGGQIRAANRPEGGARFEVDLPASTTPSPASV